MSSRIRSPARSQGARTPRRLSSRSTRSVGSPARSATTGRLSNLVDQFKEQNMESFAFSPLAQHSVLSDSTQVAEPRRKSWWKKLDDNSREVLVEAMSDNRPGDEVDVVEELEVEILSQEKKNFTLDLPDSSGSESIGSIVIPQRKLFTQKENVPSKKNFSKIVGPRESMAKLHKTNIDIQDAAPKKLFGQAPTKKTIFPNVMNSSVNKTLTHEPDPAPKKLFGQTSSRKSTFPMDVVHTSPRASVETKDSKQNLFQQGKRTKTAFPAALLAMSPNKTNNKTLGAEVKGQVRSLFGSNKGGTKRKNMFADFIVSESEDEVSEIQPKVFAFPKNVDAKRSASSTSLLLPDEDDDWKMLPSSTMMELDADGSLVKKPRLSRITQSENDKPQPANFTKMNRSKDKTSEVANASRNLSKKDSTKNAEAQNNVEQASIDNNASGLQDLDENNANVEDKQDEDAEQEIETEQDNEENEEVEEVEENEEVEGNEEIEENEDDEENKDNEENEGSAELNNSTAVEASQDDVASEDVNEQNESIKQVEDEQEIDEVMEQVAKMHGETENAVENQQLNKSELAQINKSISEKKLHNSIQKENLAESILKDHDESIQRISVQEENNVTKGGLSSGELPEVTEVKEGEDNLSMLSLIDAENQSVLQDEEDEAMQLTYEDENESLKQNEEQLEKSNKEVKESMEQDELDNNENEKSKEKENTFEEDQEEEMVDQQEEIESEQERNEAEVSELDENEVEAEVEVSQLEEDQEEEVSQQEEDQEAEVSEQEDNQNESQPEIEESEQEEELDQYEEVEQEEEDEQEVEESDQEIEEDVEVSLAESEQDQEKDQSVDQSEEVEESEQDVEITQDNDADNDDNNQEGNNDDTGRDASRDAEAIENEPSDNEIQESPNVTHDTTGRNRKVKSPEAVLQNNINRNDSFEARRLRNTSIRKTKSMPYPNHEPSLRISVGTNSSAEGSGWDSHRITKKTIRQTFGKGFTPRKSLRALVMEKSAHRQTLANEVMNAESMKIPQANSTEIGQVSIPFDDHELDNDNVLEVSEHDVSKRTRQATLEMYLQKVKKDAMNRRKKIELTVRNNLKEPSRDLLEVYNINPKFGVRKPKKVETLGKPKKVKPSAVPLGEIPQELLDDMMSKPPKRFTGNASWITKRLYKFLEDKLEPRYDYKARVKAEQLVRTLFEFTKYLRRHDAAPRGAARELRAELARLRVVHTHADFYQFFHDYMPREIRIKVVPDAVNKLPLPRDVFAPILQRVEE